MKPIPCLTSGFLVVLLFSSNIPQTQGQGQFTFVNPGAPTRVGSSNGPAAGPGYWGQALVGLTADSLSPLGTPVEHMPNGLVHGPVLVVPNATVLSTVFVQLAAWDGMVWGTDFLTVPASQFGYTDIVPVILTGGTLPQSWPIFTESAIVPVIPEPSALALAVLGGVALWASSWRRKPRRR